MKKIFGKFPRYFIIGIKLLKLTKLLKAVKLLKFTKFLTMFSTMSLSALVYAFFLGPWFSIGLVTMLFIHELGHIIAMKIKGMKTSLPVFIPMLGAIIFSPPFKNKREEAFCGYGGPLLGGLSAAILFIFWWLMPDKSSTLSETMLHVSYFAVFLNIFNLLPIRPIDGGRITQVIGGWFKYVGFAVLFVFTIYLQEPFILLIWILVLEDIKLKPKFRFYLGAILQITMMILMFFGFGRPANVGKYSRYGNCNANKFFPLGSL
ncbi:MAG: hypothetical protein HYT20_02790 [Candidatus Nealsonbacteria bacterium]|nr:hypothetical protein [Candidatus Nealsonbacteria bacterium]